MTKRNPFKREPRPITDEGALSLCQAILTQADNDLIAWRKHGDTAVINLAELKMFYRGPLFGMMCGSIDPDWYMESVLKRRIRAKKTYARGRAARRLECEQTVIS